MFYKLQTSSEFFIFLFLFLIFFWGEEFYLKRLSLPTLFISLRFGCLVQLVLTMNRERKKGFDTMGSLNFQFFSFNLVSHDISVLLDYFFLSYLILYFYVFFFGGERHKSGTKLHI